MPAADSDAHRFERDLKETASGLRFRLAIREGSIALYKIQTMYAAGHAQQRGYQYATLQAWRRQYIKACNAASAALDALWSTHQWPTDAAASPVIIWRPGQASKR